MPKKIIGFSKLSREEKIDWVAKKIFDDLRLSRCRNIYKRSLRQAKLNHISNPLLTFLRNKLLSYLPIANFMVRDIHSYDLDAELKKII